jgi:ribonuclease Z
MSMKTDRPVENVPYHTYHHNGLTIQGWSRAAVQSYWRVPELKVGFDLGAHPWDFIATPNWFISHAHLDHIAALPAYIARRRMMKMEPPNIFLPAENVDDVHRLLQAMQRLDRGRQACELIGMEPGAEIELSREHVVSCWATTHTVPSLGFVVWERKQKLKQEYIGLPGPQIRDLRLSGVAVTQEFRTPLVCYTGDTSPAGLDAYRAAFEAKILITEMSFIRPGHKREKIHKYGHLHIDDFLERLEQFHNELVILGHFSTRYTAREVFKTFKEKWPMESVERFKLWLEKQKPREQA